MWNQGPGSAGRQWEWKTWRILLGKKGLPRCSTDGARTQSPVWVTLYRFRAMTGKLWRLLPERVLPDADSLPPRDPSEWGVVSATNSAYIRWGRFRTRLARTARTLVSLLLLAALRGTPSEAQQRPAAVTLAVHGTVTNAATGEPLPRALVLANGQNGAGVLTDGDGRFEIDGLAAGPNVFQISKPGFEDAVGDPASLPLRDLRGSSHVVYVT